MILSEEGDTVICINSNQVTALNLLYNEYERLSEVEVIYAATLDSCIALKYLIEHQKLTIDTLYFDFENYKKLQTEEHDKKNREIVKLKQQNKRNFFIFGVATLTLFGALLISLIN